MSHLHDGDEDLHYSDASHRWVAPSEREQPTWEARLQAHMEAHRLGQDEHLRRAARLRCQRQTGPGRQV